jgi:hypothetical protein
METVIMYPENKEQLTALKAFAKAMNVKFETNKSPYDTDFVKKIRESKKQVEAGQFTTLDPDKSLWGNLK